MKDILIDLWVQDADFIWAKKLRRLLEEELPEIDGRPRKELLWDIGRLGISFDFSWLIFWRWIRLNRWSYLLPCGQTLPWLSLTFNDFHASAAGWPGRCSFVLVLVSLSEQTGLPHTANVAFAVALESGIVPGMVQEHHVLWLGDSLAILAFSPWCEQFLKESRSFAGVMRSHGSFMKGISVETWMICTLTVHDSVRELWTSLSALASGYRLADRLTNEATRPDTINRSKQPRGI